MIRLVKMKFRENEVENFLKIFSEKRELIQNFPGCYSVRLLRDRQDANVFFTYSVWKSEEDLESYRQSDLFRDVWSNTKKLFAEKAEAWSLDDTML